MDVVRALHETLLKGSVIREVIRALQEMALEDTLQT